MLQKLIKQTQLDIESQTVNVCYYVTRTLNGAARYSAEVEFRPEDHMILDADSVNGLQTKLDSLVPASIYSRMLSGTGNVA